MKRTLILLSVFVALIPIFSFSQVLIGLKGGYNFSVPFKNLIVKPEFVFGSRWKFIINAGAYFGILLKVKTTGEWETYGPYPYLSGGINETKNNYFNTVNFGLVGGIGTEYPISNRVIINLEANYLFGTTNLTSNALSSVFFNLLNAQLSVGLAYKINWIKKSGKERKKIEWYEG